MTELTLAEAKDEMKEQAWTYGYSRNVNPYVTLLEEVKWRAGHVAWLRTKIATASENDLFILNSNDDVIDSPIVRRYDKERTFLDRACKLAIDAGVAERYVQLAELQGAALFQVLQTAFNDPLVGLTDEQRVQLGPALQRALSASEGVLELDVSAR